MPAISIYCMEEDRALLLNSLGGDLAYIVPDGDKRWKAVKSFSPEDGSRTALWHVDGTPLSLFSADDDIPEKPIVNPWEGWEEELTGADPTTPYFGAGHPSVFWLNLNITGHEDNSECGLTTIEWVGKRYAIIGNGPSQETVQKWTSLKRKISKSTKKIPLGGKRSTTRPEVFAFPYAFEHVQTGDINPF